MPPILELLPAGGRLGFVLAGGPLGTVLVERLAGFVRGGGLVTGGRLGPVGALLELDPEE